MLFDMSGISGYNSRQGEENAEEILAGSFNLCGLSDRDAFA
jgi:hypothetical protein